MACRVNNILFYLGNKMNYLPDDQQSRIDKHRKHQYYRSMLDQQIKYRQEMRNSEKNGKGVQAYRHQSESFQVGGRQEIQKGRYRHEEERIGQQIETCEDIIKNLKALKEKQKYSHRQRTSNPQLYPIKPGNDSESYRKPFRYYPKANYFSNIPYAQRQLGSHHNKEVRTNRQHQRSRTIQEPYSERESGLPQERRGGQILPVRKSLRVVSNGKKGGLGRNEDRQSPHPEGIRRVSRLKILKNSQRSKEKSASKSSEKTMGQQSSDKKQRTLEQLEKIKVQLTQCLSDLNKIMESEDEQITKKKKNLFDGQLKGSFVTLQEEAEESENEDKAKTFKEQAIQKLKKIHQRSKKLEETIRRELPHQEMLKNSRYLNHDEDERHQSEEQESFNQARTQKMEESQEINISGQMKENNNFNSKSKNTSKSPSKESSKKPSRNSILGEQNNHEQELIDSAINHLTHQEQQNEEIVSCLKELSQYLKNHERYLKSAQKKPKNKTKQTKSSHKQSKIMQIQSQLKQSKEKYSPQKRQLEKKMQEAIVKRLKKARIRGSLLSEKIQNHKMYQSNLKESLPSLTTETDLTQP